MDRLVVSGSVGGARMSWIAAYWDISEGSERHWGIEAWHDHMVTKREDVADSGCRSRSAIHA